MTERPGFDEFHAAAGSEISMEDVEFLAGMLPEMVKTMRQAAADKGLIRRHQ